MNGEANEELIFPCADCGRSMMLGDEPMYDVDDGVLCLTCAEDAAMNMIPDFTEWAREHVKLTKDPHCFVERDRWAPTPDEYKNGMREAYTENAVAAFNRHECTNYDELIAELDRYDPRDRALYDAVRQRAEELIEERLEVMDDEELEALLEESDAEEAHLSEDLASRAD